MCSSKRIIMALLIEIYHAGGDIIQTLVVVPLTVPKQAKTFDYLFWFQFDVGIMAA